MSGLPELVRELGGDPAALFRSAGIDAADVGRHDAFVPLQRATTAVELAAACASKLGKRPPKVQPQRRLAMCAKMKTKAR